MKQPTRSGTAALLAATLVVMLASTVVPAAEANWYGATGNAGVCNIQGNITDNKKVHAWAVKPTARMTDALDHYLQMIEPQLTGSRANSYTTSTDVVTRNRYYTTWCENEWNAQWTSNGVTGVRGSAECYSVTKKGRCGQQVIRISRYFFDEHGRKGARWILCHEGGHAVGLIHRDATPGCMEDRNLTITDDVGDVAYTPHDRAHFSASWPQG